jgi:regulator of replication initiation timing
VNDDVERLRAENKAIRAELGRPTLNAKTVAENVRLTQENERLRGQAAFYVEALSEKDAEVERLQGNLDACSQGHANLKRERERLRAVLRDAQCLLMEWIRFSANVADNELHARIPIEKQTEEFLRSTNLREDMTTGVWAPCEEIVWYTPSGRCPISIDIGPHDHRIDVDGKVGALVRERGNAEVLHHDIDGPAPEHWGSGGTSTRE